jgi:hypothetical protein
MGDRTAPLLPSEFLNHRWVLVVFQTEQHRLMDVEAIFRSDVPPVPVMDFPAIRHDVDRVNHLPPAVATATFIADPHGKPVSSLFRFAVFFERNPIENPRLWFREAHHLCTQHHP